MITEEGFDFSTAKRGPVIKPAREQERLMFRIDTDILAWFKGYVEAAGGGNYQQMMNDALREYVERQRSLADKIPVDPVRAVG
ncbi:MAG: BrnA antitoxin family protein [Magnetococcales bacterium]|nr:BrnA antitoxin family protein [Magnetococcales bacterium]MBF0323310.1 BrnA antitoxin family protein [Magnetococcales bacterium]